MKRSADKAAVANFLASIGRLSALEAIADARAYGKSFGWNEATQTAVAEGITAHFAAKRDARLAARAERVAS